MSKSALGSPLEHRPLNFLAPQKIICDGHSESEPNTRNPDTTTAMSDTEMDGGIALNGASPTHSQLADRIDGGAMDVKSPNLNGAASIADSAVSSRLYGTQHVSRSAC